MSAESLGDKDGALKAFGELSNIDALGFNVLGAYHQARLVFAAGDTEKAKTLLKEAQKRLEALTPKDAKKPAQGKPSYLEQAVRDLQRRVDPSAVPNAMQALQEQIGEGDGSGALSSEKLQELIKRMGKNPGGAAPAVPAPPAGAP